MYKEAVGFVVKIYARSLPYWVGFVSEFIRTILLRVVAVLITSSLAGYVAVGDYANARRMVLLFLIAGCVGIIIGAIGDLISILGENTVYHRMSVQFYSKLIHKDLSFYKDQHTGYLTTAFRQHLDSAILIARVLRTDLWRIVVTLTATIATLCWYSPAVGLVVIAVVVVQTAYIFWASSRANVYRVRTHEAYRALSGAVADDLTNILALRSAGDSSVAEKRISILDQEESVSYHLRRKVTIGLDAPRAIITNLGLAGALWVVIATIDGTQDSVKLMVLVITYLIQISRNVDMIPDFVTNLDDLVTKLHRTLEYLEPTHEDVKDPIAPKHIDNCQGAVTVKNVRFAYKGQSGKPVTVFKDLSLDIAAREQVGIVGLSGAGKSTLASLLMRFDDVEAGSIKIDSVDIRDLRQDELRTLIAYVPQEPLLFHRTIKENILYFNPDATDEQIVAAAKAAHADEFIDALPNGYDTLVGERGVKLSGGQKQRVVLARSILKDAPIMIFDEATSALDSESEQIIQRALPEIIGKRTAIVIAHRLSTVAGLDRIIVLEKGKIKEQGTHAQLLAQKGRYYSLWQKQTNSSA